MALRSIHGSSARCVSTHSSFEARTTQLLAHIFFAHTLRILVTNQKRTLTASNEARSMRTLRTLAWLGAHVTLVGYRRCLRCRR